MKIGRRVLDGVTETVKSARFRRMVWNGNGGARRLFCCAWQKIDCLYKDTDAKLSSIGRDYVVAGDAREVNSLPPL